MTALRVQARWMKHQAGWTIQCPYCPKRHIHGAGEGERVPHCGDFGADRGDYYLVAPTEPEPPACRCHALYWRTNGRAR